MRTTVDIDRHLLDRLRDEAHAQGVSFKAILNRAIRQGLDAPDSLPEAYACPTFRMGPPLHTLDKALALAASLGDDEVARKMRERR